MREMMNAPHILISTASEGGHRSSYLATFAKYFRTVRTKTNWRALVSRLPLMVLSVEENFPGYVMIGVLRALMGRRTTGFLMRPRPALEGSTIRLCGKRYALKILRRISRIQTLTILPFSVEPRFAEIADGWIYDPQLWDVGAVEREALTQACGGLRAAIRDAAAKRQVCCAIGRQDKSKGFDLFADLYANHWALREKMLFAFGGRVDAAMLDHMGAFVSVGGFALDRFVTDAELLDLYVTADVIWCCYHPDYDQASGILSRAVQLGRPVIVRRGSLIHRLCDIEGFAHAAMSDEEDWRSLVDCPPPQSGEEAAARARRHKEISLTRLREALGL